MKNYVFIIALLFGVSTLLSAETRNWKPYTIENGKFTIKLPGMPEESTETIKTNAGDIPLYTLNYETETMAFIVNMYIYPDGLLTPETSGELFDNIQTNSLQAWNGELIEAKDVQMDNFPGRQIRLQSKTSGEYFHIHLVLVKNRLYQIIAASPAKEEPDVQAFLNSFSLDTNAGQSELEEYLGSLGLEYQIDENGQYNFTLVFQDERSQLVFITPVLLKYDSKKYYDIWSPIAKFKDDIPDDLAGKLLYQNSQTEVGAYQVLNTSSGKLVIFSTKVAAGTGLDIFKRMIIRVSSIADDAEKHITREDQY